MAVGALGFQANAREDVTSTYMTNAGLTSLTGWTIDTGFGGNGYTAWETDGDVPVIEFYHSWSANAGAAIGSTKTFNFSQTLQLPAGYYRLAVNAFYREGNGTGTNTKAYIYAGDKTQYVVGLTSGGLSSYTGKNDLYKAANAFSLGDFSNEFDFNITEDDYDDGQSYCSIDVGFHGYIDTYCSWCILGPVTLYEYTTADYISDYNDKVTVAEGLYDTPMEASVLAALKEAVVDPDGLTTVDEVQAAITALNTAIANANNSIALYENINTAITAITAQSTSGADFTAMTTKYNNGTYTAVSEVYPDYQEIEIAALGTAANTDYSSVIINPGFEFGNMTGWSTPTAGDDTGAKAIGESGSTYYMSNASGTYLFNTWANSVKTLDLTQTISGLPSGRYRLSAVVGGYNDGTKIYLTANTASSDVAPEESATVGYDINVEVALATDADLVIGANNTGTGYTFFKADNFQLTYLGNTVSDEDAAALLATVPTGIMNSTISDALSSAVSDFEDNASIDNYAALETAIANANTSIAAYATAKTAIDKANAIKDANNFASSSALSTFESAISSISDAYDARTLSDADAANAGTTLGTVVSGWHGNASGAAGVYMSDAWDNASDWTTYYINTWSTEGDNDGSGFSVPFFEYWTGSGSLGARTMTGTLVGLESEQLYKVTADVRVSYSSKVDGSITLTVGDGSAVDVTTGDQIGSTGRYLGTFTAYGKSDAEGNLTAAFTVAANSGISWLSWQNVSYEETNLDFTALNAAITAANAVNAKITNGVSTLTAAISTATALLTSATTQDEVDAGVTTLETATTAAETIVAARLKLAGTVKKATALSAYLDDDISDEISAASTYAEDADATAAEATSKTDALNAYFEEWEEVTIANGDFETGVVYDAEGNINDGVTQKVSSNGTAFEIAEWTYSTTATSWIYSASALYGSNVAVNSSTVPSTDMYGEASGAAMFLNAGWGNAIRYNQDLASLPAGKYVFYYEGINTNSGKTWTGDYTGISNLPAGSIEGQESNTFIYGDKDETKSTEWAVYTLAFNLNQNVENAKLQFGYQGGSGSAGSGNAPKMWFDNLKIYRYVTYESATMAVNATAKYGTFVAPFDVTLPEGVTAYTVSGKETEGGETTVTLTEEAAAGATLDANTPVVLKAESGLDETTFYGEATGTENENADEYLTGIYDDGTTVEAGNYVLQLNDDDELAFYALEDDITGTKNRCYLTLPGAAGAKVRVVFADDANAISAIASEGEAVEAIYTVGGTQLSSLQKGINIVKMQNGETRKVFVK